MRLISHIVLTICIHVDEIINATEEISGSLTHVVVEDEKVAKQNTRR